MIEFSILFLATVVFIPGCGGTSEQGNGCVLGRISMYNDSESGLNKSRAFVQLVNETYTPYSGDASGVHTTQSDSSGKFLLEDIPPGVYYVYAWDTVNGYRALEGPFDIPGGQVDLPLMQFKQSRRITACVPDTMVNNVGALYIKGTTLTQTQIDIPTRTAVLDSVPAGDVLLRAFHKSESGGIADMLFAEVSTRNCDSVTVSFNNSPPELLIGKTEMPSTFAVNRPYNATVNAVDPEDDPLTFSVLSAPPGFLIGPSDGVISWLPDMNADSIYQVGVRVRDSINGGSAVLLWTVKADFTDRAPAPPALISVDSADFGDTILLSSSFRPCSENTHYQFYCEDSILRTWSTDSIISFTAFHPGLVNFRISVFCAGSSSYPSELSEPVSVYFAADSVDSEVHSVWGDTVVMYSDTDMIDDTVSLQYYTYSKLCSDSEPAQFRFELDGVADGVLVIDTSEWSTDTAAVFRRYKPSGVQSARVQWRCTDSTNTESAWSEPFFTNVEQ